MKTEDVVKIAEEALDIICGAIVVNHLEEISPELQIKDLLWCEAINKDNEKIMFRQCKLQSKALAIVDTYSSLQNTVSVAIYSLAVCIARLSGYDIKDCFDDSYALISAYLNRNNIEEE